MDKLLDAQAYRLSHWKAAADEINYRRFFDINELAALCTEDPKVFIDSHKLIFDQLVSGDISGLRVNHIDGLYDPMEYLRRLQWGYLIALGKQSYRELSETRAKSGSERGAAAENGPPPWNEIEPAFLENILHRLENAPNRSASTPSSATIGEKNLSPDNNADGALHASLPLYVVVEKVLGPEEPLPEQWLVAGTTGYDFLNSINGLFVDQMGLQDLIKIYRRLATNK